MPGGGKHRAARDIQGANPVDPALGIDDTIARRCGHARGAGRMMSGHLRDQRDAIAALGAQFPDARARQAGGEQLDAATGASLVDRVPAKSHARPGDTEGVALAAQRDAVVGVGRLLAQEEYVEPVEARPPVLRLAPAAVVEIEGGPDRAAVASVAEEL